MTSTDKGVLHPKEAHTIENIKASLDFLRGLPGFEKTELVIKGSVNDTDVQEFLGKIGESVQAKVNTLNFRDCVIFTVKLVSVLSDVLIPGYGKQISALLSIGAFILKCLWKRYDEKKSEIDATEIEICKDIRHKAVETFDALMHAEKCSISTLDAQISLSTENATSLMTSLKPELHESRKFLLQISCEANELSKSKNLVEQKTVIKLFTLYVQVAAIRSSLLWRMFSLFRRKVVDWEHCTALQELGQMIEYDELKHREYFKVLTEPNYDTIHLFAVFNLSECLEIKEFGISKGFQFQNLSKELTNGRFTLKCKKWDSHYVIMSSNPIATMWTSQTPEDKQELFRFEAISEIDNTFIISSCRWSNYCISVDMDGACSGYKTSTDKVKETKDETCQWKIIKMKDGFYILLLIRYCGYFACISNDGLGKLIGEMRVK